MDELALADTITWSYMNFYRDFSKHKNAGWGKNTFFTAKNEICNEICGKRFFVAFTTKSNKAENIIIFSKWN